MNRNKRARLAVLLAVAAIAAVACSDGGGGGGGEAEETEAAQRTYGTADAEELVLGDADAPQDMELVTATSGPTTVYQFTGDEDRVETLTGLGTTGGFARHFSVDQSAEPTPTKDLKATVLDSETLIFDDAEGAAEAVSWIRDNPNPILEEVEVEEVDLGDGGFLQTATSKDGYSGTTYFWSVDNALILVGTQSPSGSTDADELLTIAQQVDTQIESVEPTGEDLDIVETPEPGEVIFEDDFEEKGEWELSFPEDPPGSGLSKYVDGMFQLGISAAGGRWNDTTEFDDAELANIGDAIVEADVSGIEGDTARWGLMCRIGQDEGWYLFVVDDKGFAGIFRAGSMQEPQAALAVVPESSILVDAAGGGEHHLRADCTGDSLARLSLYVNDEAIVEAYDDDALPPGGVGMWIESQEKEASARFDNLTVSEPGATE